jgi:Asp-tRNA(Asn)/Glu-tRNA(Gln) amidotransferase C subunit
MAGVIMGQTSRIVTIVDGVQVIEVTTHDPDGHPVETRYSVRGEKYETLKQAMEAAEWEAPPGRSTCISFP